MTSKIDRILAEESSEWLERLKRERPQDAEAFAEWLLESKRHVRQFLLMTALDEELRHFDRERKFAVPDVKGPGAEVVQLESLQPEFRGDGDGRGLQPGPAADTGDAPSPPANADAAPPAVGTPTTRKRSPISRWWSLAAMLVVFAAFVATVYWPRGNSGWEEYSTGVGEQRSVQLVDGSLMHLNTDSRVAVRMSEGARDIRLLEGEALFKVFHDPARPFRVHTLGAVIQAIGTQFNVYRREDGVKVSVVEGRVQMSSTVAPSATLPAVVAPSSVETQASGETAARETVSVLQLSAGEEARIDGNGRIEPQTVADVGRSTAWRERRLIFKQDSLRTIVDEFNRYNRVQFKLIGAGVATRRYSGAFSIDDPESLGALLASEPDLLVQRMGEEIVVRARLETGSFANSP